MDRRTFLERSALAGILLAGAPFDPLHALEPQIALGAPAPQPIAETHFPDRLHLFVWRNWELANLDRMAEVVGTSPGNLLKIGHSMGLGTKPILTQDQLRRGYITAIRQNWHILPSDQIRQLLGWDEAQYEYHLVEDDFLWVKLGELKPRCELLRYVEPTAEATRFSAGIKRQLEEALRANGNDADEPPFSFISQLSSTEIPVVRDLPVRPSHEEIDLSQGWTLRKTGSASALPPGAMEGFQEYLRAAFACKIGIADEAGAGRKTIEVSIDSSMQGGAGSFTVSVHPAIVSVVGRDSQGVRQGLYFLQDQTQERRAPYLRQGETKRLVRLDPRYVYSYFALYGDPLIEPNVDSLPDGFLEKLSRAGTNGIWLQGVLRNLAPSSIFPEFGEGSETRLANLQRLVERAQRHGISIYLYMNEPRSMPASFFDRHPEVRGTYDAETPEFYDSRPGAKDTYRSANRFYAMCTSTHEVREWIAASLAHVFARVPALGGIFCITASENLTNCFSHGHAEHCPRCSRRDGSEVVAELIQTFRDGVRRSSGNAQVIAWDWGWGKDWVKNGANSADVIQRLPQDVGLLSVSEWAVPLDRGGHRTKVGEYSISAVGPGPHALENWSLASRRGIRALAKVQWSCTWEISAVPYIPVPNLIAEHCRKLLDAGVGGLMASWTVGGYPSPNFEVAKEYYFANPPESGQVLLDVAVRRYGKAAAPSILEAWKAFSSAFVEYPMEGGGVVYRIAVQHGPANLLRLHPTGYKAAMMLFPYDDYPSWVGTYPVETVQGQFMKMAALWKDGLERFQKALPLVPEYKRKAAAKDLGVAETCYLHFQSVANQIRFYRLRDGHRRSNTEERAPIAMQMAEIAEQEIQLAIRQYAIARRDSTIGFEASNHYYYRPLDLMEKVLNCRQVIDTLRRT